MLASALSAKPSWHFWGIHFLNFAELWGAGAATSTVLNIKLSFASRRLDRPMVPCGWRAYRRWLLTQCCWLRYSYWAQSIRYRTW